MFLEETRSTLQFAARAKLVKTRATINEVLDDRSMIKKLQRELAEAKRAVGGDVDMNQIRALESEAAKAETSAKEAHEKYERLKASILKGGMFSETGIRGQSSSSVLKAGVLNYSNPLSNDIDRKRRRQSDGIVLESREVTSPLLDIKNRLGALETLTPVQDRKARRTEKNPKNSIDSGAFQILLLKEALSAKGEITRTMEQKLGALKERADQYETSLNEAATEIDIIKKDHASSVAQTELLTSEKEALELQRQDIMEELKEQSEEKDKAIKETLSTIEQILQEKESLSEKVSSLEAEKLDKEKLIAAIDTERKEENSRMQQEYKSLLSEVVHLKDQNQSMIILQSETQGCLAEVKGEKACLQKSYDDLCTEKDARIGTLKKDIVGLEAHVVKIQREREAQTSELKQVNEILQNEIANVQLESIALQGKVENLLSENQNLVTVRSENKAQIEELKADNENLHKNLADFLLKAELDVKQTQTEYETLQEEIQRLQQENKELLGGCGEIEEQYGKLKSENERLQNHIAENEAKLTNIEEKNETLQRVVDDVRNEMDIGNEKMKQEYENLQAELEKLKIENQDLITAHGRYEAQLTDLEKENKSLKNIFADTKQGTQILQNEFEDLKKEKISLLTHQIEAEAQIFGLKKENESLQNVIADIDNEKEAIIEELEEDNESLQNSIADIDNEKEAVIEELEEENESLQRTLMETRDKAEAQIVEAKDLSESLQVTILNITKQMEADCIRMEQDQGMLQGEVERLQHENQELIIVLNEKEVELEEIKEKSENLNSAIIEIGQKHDADCTRMEQDNVTLQEEIRKLELICEEKDAEKREIEVSKAEQIKTLDEVNTEKLRISFQLAGAKDRIDNLSKSNSSLHDQLELTASIVNGLKIELKDGLQVTESLTIQRHLAKALANRLPDAEDSALVEIQELVQHLVCKEKEVAETLAQYKSLVDSKKSVEEKLLQVQVASEKFEAGNKVLTETNNALNEEVRTLNSQIASLKETLAESNHITEKFMEEKALSQALADRMSAAEDIVSMELQNTKDHLNKTKSECATLIQSLCEMNEKIQAKENDNDTLTESNLALSKQIDSVRDDLARSNSLNQQLASEKESMEASNNVKFEDLLQLKTAHEEQLLQVKDLLEQETVRNNELVMSNAVLNNKILGLVSIFSELNRILPDESYGLEAVLKDEALASEELSEIKILIHSVASMRSKMSDLKEENQVLLESKLRLHHLDEEVCQMNVQKTTLEAELSDQQQLSQSLQEELYAMKLDFDRHKLDIAERTEEKLLSKSQELEQLSQHIQKLHNDLDERTSEIESRGSEADQLSREIERLQSDLGRRTTELTEMAMNLSIAKQNLVDANKELQISQKDLDHLRQEISNGKNNSHHDQIIELQQLLASANDREEEAKNIALATDEELERKERDLEEAVLYATECEAAMKDWEEKFLALQARNEPSDNQDTEKILKEMELLMEEKMDVENQLENLKDERDAMENTLKSRFDEERRDLLHEAETMMNQLRKSLSIKEEELEKYKRDARTSREELIAVQEQLKSDNSATADADERIACLTEMLTKAENASSQLKSDLERLKGEYNSFKEHTKASKDSFKQTYDSKLTAVRDELTSLRETLHREASKARSYETRCQRYEKDMCNLEEEMKSTKQSLLIEKDFAVSKLKEEIAVAKVKLSRAQADIFSLEQEVEDYKEMAKKSKQSQENELKGQIPGTYEKFLKESEEVICAKNTEIDRLQEFIKSIKKKLKTKDERIKSLEAKRMTKDHVNMINRLKVSLITLLSKSPLQFELIIVFFFLQEERKSYKEKYEELAMSYKSDKGATIGADADCNKENNNRDNHSGEITELRARTEDLEKKLRKYIAHSEDLTKEKEAMKEMINETMTELGGHCMAGNDLSSSVVTICERLHTLEEECDALNEAKDHLQRDINQTKIELKDVTLKKEEIEEELKTTRQHISDLNRKQKKLQEITDNVRGRTKDFEDEKNRQVSYLEKENLQILEENKKLKKEMRTLKTRSKAAAIGIKDEPTEDLGSILSTNNPLSDKENIVNNAMTLQKPMASSSKQHRVGLGSGEGDMTEENTQECQPS